MDKKNVAFLIEVPCIYTDDLDDLRRYQEDYGSESDWLLNCIGEPGVVKLRVEISGEKDSDIQDVYGSIREARLVDPCPEDDERLRELGAGLEPEPDELISDAVDALLRDDTDLRDICEDLEWQLERVRKRLEKAAA